MAIYTADTETAYTSVEGQEGSEIVSVFIDQAANESADTTFEAKFEDGGITITCSKALAKEIGSSFDFAATEGEADPALAKALNQLISLVAGREIALATNDEADRPTYRIGECLRLAAKEMADAAVAGDNKMIKQCQRKLESMTSLKLLADQIA